METKNQLPMFVLTPFAGNEDALVKLKENLIPQLSPNDKWIIAYDNLDPSDSPLIENDQIILIQNLLNSGAGNTRNVALDYIYKNLEDSYLLYPLDADDQIAPNSISKIKKAFHKFPERVITYGHTKVWSRSEINIGYEGVYELESLLKKYMTPCGSTIIKIDSKNEIKELKFGHRKRANDQLFFLSAVKKFKYLRCIKDPILLYKITNNDSVSNKKYKMVIYKYLALRDFGVSMPKAIYYMLYYAFFGVMRHIFKIGV